MPRKSDPNVSKLLRVLVAGGVALAGWGGVHAADKDQAGTEAARKAQEKDKEKDQKKAEAEKAAKDKKKAETDKKASQEGGGVKGW